jgi:hypothetical protein
MRVAEQDNADDVLMVLRSGKPRAPTALQEANVILSRAATQDLCISAAEYMHPECAKAAHSA